MSDAMTVVGVVVSVVALIIASLSWRDTAKALALAQCKNEWDLLPERVLLVRHGESEGNADVSLYRTKPDNQIELTEAGKEQALQAGQRIRSIVGDGRVKLVCSPFKRTIQTARGIRQAFRIPGTDRDSIDFTDIDPRIREQEFGNLQGDEFKSFRAQQQTVGRFWCCFRPAIRPRPRP